MDQIYLDHNATTPITPEVLESLFPFLRSEYGKPSSGHTLGRTARDSERLEALRDRLWDQLRTRIREIVRTSERVRTLPGTLHARFPGATGNAILDAAPGAAASTGSACHAESEEPPATIVAMGVGEAEALGSVRLSLSHGTIEAEVKAAAEQLIGGWTHAIGGNTDEIQR